MDGFVWFAFFESAFISVHQRLKLFRSLRSFPPSPASAQQAGLPVGFIFCGGRDAGFGYPPPKPRHSTGRRRKQDPTATAWVFKVNLVAKPAVWRTIAIRSDQTLDDLHAILFEAFDRFDEHMYSFHRQPLFARRGPEFNRGNVEYTSPILIEEADPFGGRVVRDASKTRVDAVELKPGDKFYYLFDFGDSWWHELTVEQSGQPLQPAYQYPFIMEKRGVSPPQYEYPAE